MRISTLIDCLMLCHKARITPAIWGHRGIGKSSAVRQFCTRNHLGFIDFRASQIEASDLRGMPDVDRETLCTTYRTPIEMPRGGMTYEQYLARLDEAKSPREREVLAVTLQRNLDCGVLFLDELPRAQDDVLQAAFQVVLDHQIGDYVLPKGWSVFVASNFFEGYMVNAFRDAAFLNRFCHLTVSYDDTVLDDWTDYMARNYGEKCSSVVEFASQNMKHLLGDVKGELGFEIQPSPRSWEMAIKADIARQEIGATETVYHEVLKGILGMEIATAFTEYSCPVRPRDIINEKGSVKKYEGKLKQLERHQMHGLMWGIISFAKENLKDAQVAENVLDFAEYLVERSAEKDIAVAFMRALVSTGKNDGNDETRVKSVVDPQVAALVERIRNRNGQPTEMGFLQRAHKRTKLIELLSDVCWR